VGDGSVHTSGTVDDVRVLPPLIRRDAARVTTRSRDRVRTLVRRPGILID
jgi:hypothetical protein